MSLLSPLSTRPPPRVLFSPKLPFFSSSKSFAFFLPPSWLPSLFKPPHYKFPILVFTNPIHSCYYQTKEPVPEMEVSSHSSTHHCCSATDYTKILAESCQAFGALADFDAGDLENKDQEEEISSVNEKLWIEESDDEAGDDDFSFVCLNTNGSPISADDVFQNGQIRPIIPLFNTDLLFSDAGGRDGESKDAAPLRPPLRKLFVEERDDVSFSSVSESDELEGLKSDMYCEWSRKVVEASPELGKKSNSTGFCKTWRFRDLVHRSKSDGKDAFVFLNNPAETTITKTKKRDTAIKTPKTEEEKQRTGTEAKKAVKHQTASSAHERHYVRNRAKKEEDRRRSYLPYRQDLVGFFASVNGFSRNIHPF